MAEEKGIRSAPPKDSVELKQRIKELEAKIKEKDKEIEQKNKKLQEEQKEIKQIEEVFESSDRIWGYRNITKELRSKGVEISEYKVRRLMRENGLYPELAVKFKPQRNGKSDGRYCKDRYPAGKERFG